jgi:hypothetical protein
MSRLIQDEPRHDACRGGKHDRTGRPADRPELSKPPTIALAVDRDDLK